MFEMKDPTFLILQLFLFYYFFINLKVFIDKSESKIKKLNIAKKSQTSNYQLLLR